MATNDFLPFAGDPAANVQPQSQYSDPGYIPRILGFSSGTAISTELNKVWRQASLIAHMIGKFTMDATGRDMLDDATPSGVGALENNFTQAIQTVALGAIGVGYLPLTGGALSGSLTINAPLLTINAPATFNAYVQLSRNSGRSSGILGYTGTSDRWHLLLCNNDLEQGSDTGSNFAIQSYHDNGAPLDTPLSINRATGIVNFSHSPTVNGSNLPYVRLVGDVMGGALGVGGTGISYNGLGGYWAQHHTALGWDGQPEFAVDGTYVGALALQSWVSTVASGYVLKTGDVMSGYLTVNAGATVQGNFWCGGQINIAGLGDFADFYGQSRYRYRQWAGNWYDVWDGNNGVRTWYANGQWMTLDGSGNLATSGAYRNYAGRILSMRTDTWPSVCAYWTAANGVATGFYTSNEGMNFGNMDGNGNPVARHMLLDNNGYLTLWGSTTIDGNLWSNATISASGNVNAYGSLWSQYDINLGRNLWAGGALTAGYIHSTGSLDVDGGMGVQTLNVRDYLGVGGNIQCNNNVNSNTITTNHVQSNGDIGANGQIWCYGGAVVAQNGPVYAFNGNGGCIMHNVGIYYRQLGGQQIAFRWDGTCFWSWIDGGEKHVITGNGDQRVRDLHMYTNNLAWTDSDGSGWFIAAYRSDSRLKRNIALAADFDSLGAIVRTPIRSFEWLEHDDRLIPHGFVSTDLRETLPDVVQTMPSGKDELGDVDHIDILPMLAHCFRAIRQLHEEIAALRGSKDHV